LVSITASASTPASKPGPRATTIGAMPRRVPRLRLAMIASTSASGLIAASDSAFGSASTGTGPDGPALASRASAASTESTRIASMSSTCARPSYIASERQTVRRMALGVGDSSATTRKPAWTSRAMTPVARSPAPRTTIVC